MSLHSQPSERREYEENLDKHSHSHNQRGKTSAEADDYHHSKDRLEEGKDDKCRPTTLEEQSGIARENKVVGLQFVDYMQCDEHSDKESQEEYRAIDEPILAHK